MKDERLIHMWDSVNPDEDAQRRMRAQVAGAAGKEEVIRFIPRGMKKSVAVALAAALVLVLSATALAATGFFGAIGWDGKPVATPDMPAPSSLPEQTDGAALETAVNDYLLQAPGDEMWFAIAPNGISMSGKSTALGEMVESFDALKTLVEGAETVLPMLREVPAGYTYSAGQIWFYAPTGSALRLLGTSDVQGVTIERYAVDGHIRRGVQGYSFDLTSAAGDTVTVTMDAERLDTEYVFGVDETDTYESVTVAGMDDALLLTRPYGAELLCRRPLARTEFADLSYEMMVSRYGMPIPEGGIGDYFDSAVCRISSDTLNGDTLLAIANGMR